MSSAFLSLPRVTVSHKAFLWVHINPETFSNFDLFKEGHLSIVYWKESKRTKNEGSKNMLKFTAKDREGAAANRRERIAPMDARNLDGRGVYRANAHGAMADAAHEEVRRARQVCRADDARRRQLNVWKPCRLGATAQDAMVL